MRVSESRMRDISLLEGEECVEKSWQVRVKEGRRMMDAARRENQSLSKSASDVGFSIWLVGKLQLRLSPAILA